MQKHRVPSTVELKNKISDNEDQILDYINGLEISSYERAEIAMLEERLLHLDACPLKLSLQKCIDLRKHQLWFLEQMAQLEKNKEKLEEQRHQLEERKQDFHEDIQTRKLGLSYFKLILTLAMFLLINCGIYAIMIRYSQYAAEYGISLDFNQAAALFRISIFALALGVIFTSIGFCLFGCYIRYRWQKKGLKDKQE